MESYTLPEAKASCTEHYSEGQYHATYVPDIGSERELMRLQYIFQSEETPVSLNETCIMTGWLLSEYRVVRRPYGWT